MVPDGDSAMTFEEWAMKRIEDDWWRRVTSPQPTSLLTAPCYQFDRAVWERILNTPSPPRPPEGYPWEGSYIGLIHFTS